MADKLRMAASALAELPNRLGGVPLLYYSGYPNFGDVLGRDLLGEIAGKAVYRPLLQRAPHLIFLGSLVSQANKKSVIAGAGLIAQPEAKIEVGPTYFVRGGLTSGAIIPSWRPEGGVVHADAVQVLGDASLRDRMLKRYSRKSLPPEISSCKRLVVLHHTTYESIFGVGGWCHRDGEIAVISTGAPVGLILNSIANAKSLCSDALHPLIVADALGVGNCWIRVIGATNLIGNDFKFRDYGTQFEGKGMSCVQVPLQDFMEASRAAIELAEVRVSRVNPTDLKNMVQDAVRRVLCREA